VTTWRLVLEYDGTGYGGWQRQPDVRTLQQELEEALAQLFGGEAITVIASGRTDAGVHALGQVVSFRARATRTADQVQRGLNALLPSAIAVVRAEVAAPDFHALADARGKHYRYRLRAGRVRSPLRRDRCWTTGFALDLAAMDLALGSVIGTHDFTSFRASGCTALTPVRTVTSIELVEVGDEAYVEVRGRGFLRYMVRNLVGSSVEVARGRHAPEWMAEVLAARDRGRAGPTAPAHGLCLVAVDYDPHSTATLRSG